MNRRKRARPGCVLATMGLVVASFAGAQERLGAPPVVTQYCSGCHGLSGKAQLPYVPRLAGMGAAYLEGRFAAYKAAISPPIDEAFNGIAHLGRPGHQADLTIAAKADMVGVARLVSDKDAKGAIEWYASRQPAFAKGQNGKTIEQGQRLYRNGVEAQGLQACQSCHGYGAEGSDNAPRLAGQNAAYVFGQLALFRSGERRDSPMSDVARHLADDQARAVATYLQSR